MSISADSRAAFPQYFAIAESDVASRSLLVRAPRFVVLRISGALGQQAGFQSLEGGEAGVWNVPVDKLGQPRMTDIRLLRDGLPIPLTLGQDFFDFVVKLLFHPLILGKHSLAVKEHIPREWAHSTAVPENPLSINEIVARNLAYWMGEAKLTQAAVAEKAGVDQKTISNYLNPRQRAVGASGKEPSAKLSELDAIARAIHIEVWQLTRQMTASERAMYSAIEKAFADLRASAVPAETGEQKRDRLFRGAAKDVAKKDASSVVTKKAVAPARKKV